MARNRREKAHALFWAFESYVNLGTLDEVLTALNKENEASTGGENPVCPRTQNIVLVRLATRPHKDMAAVPLFDPCSEVSYEYQDSGDDTKEEPYSLIKR